MTLPNSLLENATDDDVNGTNDYRFNPYMDLNNAYNHTLDRKSTRLNSSHRT